MSEISLVRALQNLKKHTKKTNIFTNTDFFFKEYENIHDFPKNTDIVMGICLLWGEEILDQV